MLYYITLHYISSLSIAGPINCYRCYQMKNAANSKVVSFTVNGPLIMLLNWNHQGFILLFPHAITCQIPLNKLILTTIIPRK